MLEAPAIAALTILVLALFVGVEVISKVPPLLHTPLMWIDKFCIDQTDIESSLLCLVR